MNKILIGIVGSLVLLISGYFLLTSYLSTQEEIGEEPQRVTLEGEYVCLPLREGQPDRGDCAAGLSTPTGFYAIDLGLMSQTAPSLVQGERIKAMGIVTPIETLSTDYWDRFEVSGIFSVTNALEKLEPEVVAVPPSTSTTTSSTFVGRNWVWQSTKMLSGESLVPKGERQFVLQFTPDSRYQSTTDCNSLGGGYVIDGEVLSLESPIATKMYCEGSLESEYVTQLLLVNSYVIENNELRFNLKGDYGTMIFVAEL